MKTLNCIKTGLTAAFRAQGVYPGIRLMDRIAGNSTNCGHEVPRRSAPCPALRLAQTCPLTAYSGPERRPVRDEFQGVAEPGS
jgi:hypothetical protein